MLETLTIFVDNSGGKYFKGKKYALSSSQSITLSFISKNPAMNGNTIFKDTVSSGQCSWFNL